MKPIHSTIEVERRSSRQVFIKW